MTIFGQWNEHAPAEFPEGFTDVLTRNACIKYYFVNYSTTNAKILNKAHMYTVQFILDQFLSMKYTVEVNENNYLVR